MSFAVVLSSASRTCAAFAALAAAIAAPASASAQQPAAPAGQPKPATSRVLTLDGAIDLAAGASEQVDIAAAAVTRAEGSVKLARSERFPQLFGSLSYDRTLESEFEGLFDAPPAEENGTGNGTGNGNGNGNGDGGTGDELDFSQLPFGQPNVYRVGLSFSQLLYSGGRVTAQQRLAEFRRDSASLGLTASKAQTVLDVAQAFYDAALADRLVTIAEETYAQADRALKVTEEQRKAGRVAEFELLRARVARDSLQPQVVRARNARELAYLRLKQLIEVPLDEPLTLVADLEDPELPAPPRFASRVAEAEAKLAAAERVPVAQALNEVRVAEEAINIARAARRPEIAFRSDYGLVTYPEDFPTGENWRRNWTVGIGMSLPIFTGGRLAANELIARADAAAVRAQARLTAELAALDEETTRQDLQAARVEWQVSGATIEQAQQAYQIAELRYNEGLSTQLELSDARLQLAQALVTRAEAARNLQVGRIRYALLPQLPLNGVGATTTAPTAVSRGTEAATPTAGRPPASPGTTGTATLPRARTGIGGGQ